MVLLIEIMKSAGLAMYSILCCPEKMVDIIFVNWNSGRQLLEAILSISVNHKGLVKSVIVVDNNSVDDSLTQIEPRLASLPFKVNVIQNCSNHGFGAACNQGARLSTSKYMLFLNPDAAIYSDTLSKSLAYMENPTNQKVGICGVQLLDENGHISRSCSRFPSISGFASHACGLTGFFPHLGNRMAEWDHARTREVDQVIGAYFLVRRNLFESLHGFDERFFVYFEEVDFSYRAHEAGWQSVYLADAQAFHAGGGTSNQVKARRLFYSLRSRLLYAFKHFSLLNTFGILLVTLAIEPCSRSALALLRRSKADLKETWTAYSMLGRWLPQWVYKRQTR